jgi:hypothetical protein
MSDGTTNLQRVWIEGGQVQLSAHPNMGPTTKTWRHRINVSYTSKGAVAKEGTFEGSGFTLEEVIAESEALTQYLQQKYPVENPG